MYGIMQCVAAEPIAIDVLTGRGASHYSSGLQSFAQRCLELYTNTYHCILLRTWNTDSIHLVLTPL
jgi:hypothetical protein